MKRQIVFSNSHSPTVKICWGLFSLFAMQEGEDALGSLLQPPRSQGLLLSCSSGFWEIKTSAGGRAAQAAECCQFSIFPEYHHPSSREDEPSQVCTPESPRVISESSQIQETAPEHRGIQGAASCLLAGKELSTSSAGTANAFLLLIKNRFSLLFRSRTVQSSRLHCGTC